MELAAELSLETLVSSDNLASALSDDDLTVIAGDVIRAYESDKGSRSEWEQRNADAMKLALQVMEGKSFPWPGASNVKFPLVTIAALQFHARAYPALVPSTQIVGCQVVGDDLDGKKSARAKRVSEHMSYQLMEEYSEWEEGMDKALLVSAICGCAFKKTYYDPVCDIKKSELVLPKDLVVDYFTKSLTQAARVTHVIELSPNTLVERQRQGMYHKAPEGRSDPNRSGPLEVAQDQRQGLAGGDSDDDTPLLILEQHRWLDLDGDGYKEPYIVTVDQKSSTVLRIVARFTKASCRWSKDNEIIAIDADEYFTKYPFVPSPDGGFYDIGYGALLYGTNHAVDTLINQLIDAGTMQTTKGGFLGRGVKVRGGDYSFKPNEWKRTDTTGEDLQKNIVPLPVGEPSAVLFQLLTLLIDFGTKVGGATDPMVGENPGQNTPAETSRNTIHEGRKVFNAIYKRQYRAMKEEFRKLYTLNFRFGPENGIYEYSANGKGGTATKMDYALSAKGVVPTADPYITSEEEAKAQINDLFALLQTPLGSRINTDELLSRFMSSRRVTNPQALIKPPQPQQPPPPDPKIIVAQIQSKDKQAQLKLDYEKLVATTQQQQATLMEQQRVNNAQIDFLESQAAAQVAKAQGEADQLQIAQIDAQIGLAKIHQAEMQRQQDELHNQRQTFIDALEHMRNVEKDKNDAKAKQSRVG